MATLTKFEDFSESLVDGTAIDFSTATIKCALVTSVAALTAAAGQSVATILTNEVSGVGYTATGESLTNVTVSSAAGVTTVDADDLSWADSSGGFANARYAVFYSGTVPIGFSDLSTNRTNDGVTFNLKVNALGLFTVQ